MWDTKYRPIKFSEVLGQPGAVAILKERLRNGSAIDTSYIFVGGAGQGKTTLARILARAILCENLDLKDPEPCNVCDNCKAILNETAVAFVEQDAASNGTIENIRALVDELPFAVMGARKRIYLFDEAHRMSNGAQDVLLKPLEEKKVIGMFATTEPEKIRAAIRSRCETYTIRKATREEILARMKMVLAAENVEGDDDAILTVIDYCNGHVRNILNALEMISLSGRISIENVRSYLNLSIVATFYEILLLIPTDVQAALKLAEDACARVTPEEVTAGLGEAAMSSFRLANKMFVEFVYVDRNLAEKVYAQYQEACIALAEFFTRSRHATQIGLMCDLLTLSRTISVNGDLRALTVKPSVVMPPTIVINAAQVVAPVSAQQAPMPTPAVTAAPAPAPTPKVEAAPPAPTAAPTPPPAPAPKASLPPGVRPDGVGDLGKDPLALTEVDSKGVPLELPKQRKTSKQPALNFNDKNSDWTEIVPPDEWRQLFEKMWTA